MAAGMAGIHRGLMSEWMALIGFYLWLGFTLGYFFRKWLEIAWIPGFEAERTRKREAEEATPSREKNHER